MTNVKGTTNEEARQLVEAQVRAEQRVRAFVKSRDDIDRWEWPVWTKGNRKDSLTEVELVYTDGTREFMAPVDMPEVTE